ncbi:MAG: hypothetical protein U1F37_20560 [Alphaproteobacteria bacterium]
MPQPLAVAVETLDNARALNLLGGGGPGQRREREREEKMAHHSLQDRNSAPTLGQFAPGDKCGRNAGTGENARRRRGDCYMLYAFGEHAE